MDPITAQFVLAVGALALKYGLPATIQIIKAWDVKEPTEDDIKKLHELVPPAASYFDEPGQSPA